MSKEAAVELAIKSLATLGAQNPLAGLLAGEAQKNVFENARLEIKKHGTEIVLPSYPVQMTIPQAIVALQRKMADEETEISVHEEVNAFPLEGAYAFMLALKEKYGWANPQARQTFFGPKPPTTVNVEIDYGVNEQVIWGDFNLPGVEGFLSTGATEDKDDNPIFVIGGKVKKKYQDSVKEIALLTRKIAHDKSIYRGKAIQLVTDDDGDVDHSDAPRFLDLSKVNPNELTFSDTVMREIETSLFTPVEHTDACREHKIPLKRGVLLEGPFGTGKTLTAFVTAQKARANGWTFVLVDRVSGLDAALSFARRYQPAVVFAEDIDRAVSGDTRTVEIDDILNTIDGIQSKGTEVITILTSNDVKQINRAMVRPGRLDSIISVTPPDAKAVEKLIRIYSQGLLDDTDDLTSAGRELDGQIPAVIREVVERSKLYAISRAGSGDIKVTCDDLVASARGMKAHLDLLNGKKKEELSLNEQLGQSMTKVIQSAVKGNGLYEVVERIKDDSEAVRTKLQC